MSGSTGDMAVFPLAEALRLGSASAREALARLFSPAPVSLGSLERFSPEEHVGPAPTFAAGFALHGAFGGRVLLAGSHGSWNLLAGALLRRETSLSERAAREAIAELANIVASSFLNGMARLAGSPLLPSPPVLGPLPSEDAGVTLSTLGPEALAAPFRIELPTGRARTVLIASIDLGGIP